jgi:hypothetical protein
MLTDDTEYTDLGADATPNAPCAASPARPMSSATPSASTPSRLHEHITVTASIAKAHASLGAVPLKGMAELPER